MKTNAREILLYYNPNSNTDRMTVAYAKSVVPHVKLFAFGKTPSTSTSWQQIICALDLHPKMLMNKAHPYYQEHLKGREFDEEGWINVIRRNPELLKAPIAVRGGKAVLCLTPTDIYKLSNPGVRA